MRAGWGAGEGVAFIISRCQLQAAATEPLCKQQPSYEAWSSLGGVARKHVFVTSRPSATRRLGCSHLTRTFHLDKLSLHTTMIWKRWLDTTVDYCIAQVDKHAALLIARYQSAGLMRRHASRVNAFRS